MFFILTRLYAAAVNWKTQPTSGQSFVPYLADAADCFCPAEDLFNLLPFSLTDRIALVTSCAVIDCAAAIAGVLSYVRCDIHLSQTFTSSF